ncbi:hypothetical protein [Blastococcus sp. CCUG 61487]|uniref:hypothetical protein n=1 Tax=Blastococcus sp. CCUG 61487 TaxID=1840703 RepID=UPI0010BFAEFC|nr:hypothetical protein [Blastococcus sp. CCUG 61487]TKJ23395.1 hypothetical protein A6V29_05145 [Blastococcus sp. CCUG 61487]
MTRPRPDHARQLPGGFAEISEEEQEDPNPVIQHLAVFKTRARMVDDSRVENRAREMHAANSFEDWDHLSSDDQELWRHMARLDLL